MTTRWAQYAAFLALTLALAGPIGGYLVRVFERQRTLADPILGRLERLIHRLLGVDPTVEMSWQRYLTSFVAFGVLNVLAVYLFLRFQHRLPGAANHAALTTPMPADLALNISVSFVTGTTWQAYAGESTLTYGAQCMLAAQGFLAGASGLAVGMAFARGFARDGAATLGNFWADLVRGLLWIFLPVAVVGALVLVWQGVPCTFGDTVHATTLEGARQVIPRGPVAALELIKNLGTNGGGFFNANGAHPFANPTPLTNFVGLLAIGVIPAALVVAFGKLLRRPRLGWTLLGVMVLLFVVGLVACDWAELHGTLEGKEVRFGSGGSVLAAIVTSNGATGSFNAAHASFTPIGVLVTLFNMLLGEIVFGGLGTGLYGMLMTALVAVFLGGLMIGRTPEIAGKQLGPGELTVVTAYMIASAAAILSLAALACVTPAGRAGLVTNDGARGLSEILYAYASTSSSNGLSMAGLSVTSPFYNLTTAAAMLFGRYLLTGLALALAGRLAAQGRRAVSRGTLPTDTPGFGGLVAVTAVLVGGLCYLPALMLGPILEHLSR